MAAYSKGIKTTQRPSLYRWAYWGLMALIFFPPFFRGLFFPEDQQKVLMLAVVCLWLVCLWKFKGRDFTTPKHPLDFLMLALPAVYLISVFNAANYGYAVNEVLRYSLYFLVYWLGWQLIQNDSDAEKLLLTIFASAVLVALAGFATASGLIYISAGYLSSRIGSTFQYSNTLASFLAVAALLGVYAWDRFGGSRPGEGPAANWVTERIPYSYLLAAGNFIVLAAFFGTRSRGGMLVTAGILLVYLIGLSAKKRVPVLTHLLVNVILGYITADRFIQSVDSLQATAAWLWIAGGLVLALSFQAWYNYRLGDLLNRINPRLATRALLGSAAAVFVVGAGYAVLHSNAAEAFRSVFSDTSLQARFTFMRDALPMIGDRPLLGWGGGGWKEVYQSYQSYQYNSTMVHSYYLQAAVEAGILGLAVVMGIWGTFLYTAWKSYRSAAAEGTRRFLVWSILMAALVVGIHSIIDFDIALAALGICLWTLFGTVRSLRDCPEPGGVEVKPVKAIERNEDKSSKPQPEGGKKKRKAAPAGGPEPVRGQENQKGDPAGRPRWLTGLAVFGLLLFLVSLSFTLGRGMYEKSMEYLSKNNYSKGIEMLEMAVGLNPINSDYRSILLISYIKSGQKDKAEAQAQKASALIRYNGAALMNMSSVYLNLGKNQEAVQYAQRAVEAMPWEYVRYENLAYIQLQSGIRELAAGNKETARRYLESAAGVPEIVKAKAGELNEQQKLAWQGPELTVTPTVSLHAGEAQYLLGRWPQAESSISGALSSPSAEERWKGEGYTWLALVKDRQGKIDEANELLGKSTAIDSSWASAYETLKRLEPLADKV
ncbi:MAG: hypothetical protein HPY50_07925 [Firmicutes bacterium]|nr:hypothetical protein [Bacillota bacterium]